MILPSQKVARRGQALIELALVVPFLILLASLVLQAGSVVQARLKFDAANAAVLRIAFENSRTAEELEALFARELGGTPDRYTFELTTLPADPELDNLPSARIASSFRVAGVGILAISDGPVTLKADLATMLKVTGTPGILVAADEL